MNNFNWKSYQKPQQKSQPKAPRKHEEHDIQVSFVSMFAWKYPLLKGTLFAIPNGTKLSGGETKRKLAGKRLKDEGLLPGAADMFLSIPSGPYHGLYLETKTPAGKQQENQKQFQKIVQVHGYRYEVYRSPEEGIDIVTDYLNL